MSMLDNIEAYLVSKDAIPAGYAVYHDFMPAAPYEVVILNEYAGKPGYDFNLRSIQVQCRADNADDAKSNAWTLFNALNVPFTKQVLLDTTIVLVHMRQTPFKITSDTNSVTYGFNIGVTTNITM